MQSHNHWTSWEVQKRVPLSNTSGYWLVPNSLWKESSGAKPAISLCLGMNFSPFLLSQSGEVRRKLNVPGGLEARQNYWMWSLPRSWCQHPSLRQHPGGSAGKESPAMWETRVRSLGWEDPLRKGKATHSCILAWRIPWTVESMGSQRVRHDWATFTFTSFTFLRASAALPRAPLLSKESLMAPAFSESAGRKRALEPLWNPSGQRGSLHSKEAWACVENKETRDL